MVAANIHTLSGSTHPFLAQALALSPTFEISELGVSKPSAPIKHRVANWATSGFVALGTASAQLQPSADRQNALRSFSYFQTTPGFWCVAFATAVIGVGLLTWRYMKRSQQAREELSRIRNLPRAERRKKSDQEKELTHMLGKLKRRTGIFILSLIVMAAVGAGLASHQYGAVNTALTSKPSLPPLVRKAPPAPRIVFSPIPDKAKREDKEYVRARLLDVLKRLNRFDEGIQAMDLPPGFTREEVSKAVKDFEVFVAKADIGFTAYPTQMLGVAESLNLLQYSPTYINDLLLDPESHLVHEAMHLLKRQRERNIQLEQLTSQIGKFVASHVDVKKMQTEGVKGRTTIDLAEVMDRTLWDLDSLKTDPAAYEQAREIIQIHWQHELEANALQIAYIAAKARLAGVPLDHYIRSRPYQADTQAKLLNLADGYGPGEIGLRVIETGLNEVFHNDFLTDLFVALRRKEEAEFSKEKMKSNANNVSYQKEIAAWARRVILPESVGRLPLKASNATFFNSIASFHGLLIRSTHNRIAYISLLNGAG